MSTPAPLEPAPLLAAAELPLNSDTFDLQAPPEPAAAGDDVDEDMLDGDDDGDGDGEPDVGNTDDVPDSEPLDDDQYAVVLARVLQMGVLPPSDFEAVGIAVPEDHHHNSSSVASSLPTAHEQELAHMVLRLVHESRFLQAQVGEQAEAIEGLSAAHDFAVARVEEEHERFDAERRGWERSSEAMLSQLGLWGASAGQITSMQQNVRASEQAMRSQDAYVRPSACSMSVLTQYYSRRSMTSRLQSSCSKISSTCCVR
ncbi:hypothetical protein BKA62DRAFT_483962 [Auriculariales sp. MPI-PUGE-AT-0066]|nr:hypothetical protein BKA62DRAFT_483962 [Auriculariales sp. MPI-PUGE-AT-0066]